MFYGCLLSLTPSRVSSVLSLGLCGSQIFVGQAFAGEFIQNASNQAALLDTNHRKEVRKALDANGEYFAPTQEHCKSHTFQNGDKEKFYVNVESSICVNSKIEKEASLDQMGLQIAAQSVGNATIMNSDLNLFSVGADAQLPLIGSPTAKADILVLGYQVWSGSATLPELTFQKSFTLLNFEKTISSPIKIGPIPATLDAGIRARLDADVQGSLAFVNARAILKPHLTSSGFAEVKVDALIAEAGVQGDLEFLNDRILLEGNIGVGIDSSASATPLVYVAGGAFGHNEFESMNGALKLFAKFKNQEDGFEKEFFNFPGTVGDSKMFDLKFGPAPIFQKYLDLPN